MDRMKAFLKHTIINNFNRPAIIRVTTGNDHDHGCSETELMRQIELFIDEAYEEFLQFD